MVYPQNLLLQAVGWCMFMLINKRDCIFLNQKTLILLSTTVILSLIIGLFVILLNCETPAYPHSNMANEDYAKALGLPNIACTYPDFIELKGPGKEEIYYADSGAEGIIVTFNNIRYYFLQDTTKNSNQNNKENYDLVQIVIRDPSIRFGKHKIGVGSAKKEIEKVYRKNEVCYETELLGSGYIDGTWLYVRFLYDDNDCVKQMSISRE